MDCVLVAALQSNRDTLAFYLWTMSVSVCLFSRVVCFLHFGDKMMMTGRINNLAAAVLDIDEEKSQGGLPHSGCWDSLDNTVFSMPPFSTVCPLCLLSPVWNLYFD